jgi:8-amino-7-oxononanoate synthase
MDGDLAPLPQLLALCERHGAWLVVDDAHGFGVLGANGRGALEHFKLRSPNLVYVGTLGKAAGVGGAFIAAHERDRTADPARPPLHLHDGGAAGAGACAAGQPRHHRGRRGPRAPRPPAGELLIAQLDGELQLERWQRPASTPRSSPSSSAPTTRRCAVSAALHEQGLWVPAIRPPTVPPGRRACA